MPARLLRFGTGDFYLHEATEQDHARATYGISTAKITEGILQALAKKR